ncbi:MAG TPA: LuxR C-terminal-related transcriptional regulator [Terriglobales bacterium]|nr:LuxR C-terminal-related transcriptional regulator [Terriglobales bacterium]
MPLPALDQMWEQEEADVVPAPLGFLLLDSSFRPVSFNPEAFAVLTFPEKPPAARKLELLQKIVHTRLLARRPGAETKIVPQFISGRRTYQCRSFTLNSELAGGAHPSVAVLLERKSTKYSVLSILGEQFSLTAREKQVVELLMQGLTSKEVAERMKISPNTVKAFLRLVMIKMKVSTRSGIIGKIVEPRF